MEFLDCLWLGAEKDVLEKHNNSNNEQPNVIKGVFIIIIIIFLGILLRLGHFQS